MLREKRQSLFKVQWTQSLVPRLAFRKDVDALCRSFSTHQVMIADLLNRVCSLMRRTSQTNIENSAPT
jgi:hypothetical protein